MEFFQDRNLAQQEMRGSDITASTSRRLGLIVRREPVAPGRHSGRLTYDQRLNGDGCKGELIKRITCWDVRCFRGVNAKSRRA